MKFWKLTLVLAFAIGLILAGGIIRYYDTRRIISDNCQEIEQLKSTIRLMAVDNSWYLSDEIQLRLKPNSCPREE